MGILLPKEAPAGQRRRELVRIRLGVGLGLLFLAGALSDLLDAPMPPGRRAALLLGLGAFVALYVALMPPLPWLVRRGPRAVVAALGLLPAIAVALLLAGAPESFLALFIYFVAAAGLLLPTAASIPLIAVTALGAGIASVAEGESGGGDAALVLTVVAIGAMMAAFGRAVRANRELRASREELARLAVSEERLRIARDLHDLLGHSLSVIALKSELARKLVERDPPRAESELDEIGAVTREALAEVREAVRGYRRLALSDAVSGAQSALAAAGIACELSDTDAELPAEVDTVLAWAVREGATNVIRHSRARRCSIRIRADGAVAALEISDDGRASAGELGAGSGLAGLRERAQRMRGTLEAGARPDGGFRLRLTVPLAQP